MSDSTSAARQQKRLNRMAERGLHRSTVIVHETCRPALDALRSHLVSPDSATLLKKFSLFIDHEARPVNVAQVKHLSPFRYPGGKTWLVPEVRKWVTSLGYTPKRFIEPFAGGAIVGLSVAVEKLAEKVVLCELDEDVAAVWQTILAKTDKDAKWLCKEILSFKVSHKNVTEALSKTTRSRRQLAFQVIIKNRMQRGGILAAGASLMKNGENGKGLKSRWYPETLVRRIRLLNEYKDRIEFYQQDAFKLIEKFGTGKKTAWFIDPPYTAGGKSAGRRLYSHSSLDHTRLFKMMKVAKGDFMMTYNDADEVKLLAATQGFKGKLIPMKNTHHEIINELLVFRA